MLVVHFIFGFGWFVMDWFGFGVKELTMSLFVMFRQAVIYAVRIGPFGQLASD
jgi:hypothetical protein